MKNFREVSIPVWVTEDDPYKAKNYKKGQFGYAIDFHRTYLGEEYDISNTATVVLGDSIVNIPLNKIKIAKQARPQELTNLNI